MRVGVADGVTVGLGVSDADAEVDAEADAEVDADADPVADVSGVATPDVVASEHAATSRTVTAAVAAARRTGRAGWERMHQSHPGGPGPARR